MRRLAAAARVLLLALVAAALAAVVTLLAADHGGWLRSQIRAELARRLGEPLELQAAHISWLGPGVVLEGLALGPRDEGAPHVDALRVTLGWSAGRVAVERVELRGGRALVDDPLLERLRALRGDAAPARALPRLPEIVVHDLRLALGHPRWGALPLGRVDAVCRSGADGMPRIEGRLVPAIAAAESAVAGGGLYLEGRLAEPAMLELYASCERLELGRRGLPASGELAQLRALDVAGRLALIASARISLDGSAPSTGSLRGRLRGGSFAPPTTARRVEGFELDFEAELAPSLGRGLADPRSWSALARGAGRWSGSAFEAWGAYGRAAGPDHVGHAWLRARDVPLERETLAAVGQLQRAERTWSALEPRGRLDLAAALRLPHEGDLEAALDIELDGGAAATYRGFRDPWGRAEGGFPMPVETVRGRALVVYTPARPSRAQLALVDLLGDREGSAPGAPPVRAELLLRAAEGGGLPRFELGLDAPAIPIDARLAAAVAGLPQAEWVWPAFSPSGGELSVRGRLRRAEPAAGLAGRLTVDVRDASLRWAELPAQLDDVDGALELVFDPRHAWGLGYALEGTSVGSERLVAEGRVQTEPLDAALARELDRKRREARNRAAAGPVSPPGAGAGSEAGGADGPLEPRPRLEDHALRVDNLALRGVDRDAVVARLAGVGAAMEPLAPVGKADVVLRAARPLPGQPLAYQVEIAPRQVRFSPQAFKVETRNVRGRVVVAGTMEPGAGRAATRVVPLVGDWPGETRVAALASFETGGEGRLALYGSGLDPANRNLAGAFRQAFAGGRDGAGGLDLAALRVDGRVDFAGEIALPPEPGARPRTVHRVFLRGNDLESRGGRAATFGLQRLEGVLVQRDGVLEGQEVRALLGSTPLLLREARFLAEAGAWRLETRLDATDLPLDREHLSFFLDPATVRALVDELGLAGTVDVDGARLALSGSPEGGQRVEFSGDVLPRATRVDIGLPLEIDSARVGIESLVFEGRHVRAWAQVEQLDGTIADRRLQEGRLQLTYVEPHLSVLDLDGRLEGGRMRNLGGSPAFSIDLAAPFPFDLALRMDGVQVGGLLRGLFESDFASKGELAADLRLSGDLGRLTGIRGEGSLDLTETTLWSIPVMRDLFSQLGFDETAVFERMRSRFQVRDGVVSMSGMHVYSPLLQLVGSGSLDLDGSLHHDLQVRYSLVDRLGPLTRMVYWVQNNLLSVAIRGDMQRPRVVLKGALSILQRIKSGSRDLPLPALSPLPERF